MNKEIPKNIDAEQSVIGSMFLTKKALDKVLENLHEDSFYLDSHKKIFIAVSELYNNKLYIQGVSIPMKISNIDINKRIKTIGRKSTNIINMKEAQIYTDKDIFCVYNAINSINI